MKNNLVPKVQATKEYQKELESRIREIKEDTDMLPDMFRQLVADSHELEKQKNEAIASRDKALQSDHWLRKQNKNLKEELDRKMRLSLQAIAARSGIKAELDASMGKIKASE